MRSLYVHLTQCVELLSKHLEENIKHLLGMDLATDAIFLVLSSVNNYLSIYVYLFIFMSIYLYLESF